MDRNFLDWMGREGYANLSNSYRNLMHVAYMAGIRESYNSAHVRLNKKTVCEVKKAVDYALTHMPEEMLYDEEMMRHLTIFNSIYFLSCNEN